MRIFFILLCCPLAVGGYDHAQLLHWIHWQICAQYVPRTSSVRNDPGLFCQGCARSVPDGTPTPSPCFFVSVDSKGGYVEPKLCKSEGRWGKRGAQRGA